MNPNFTVKRIEYTSGCEPWCYHHKKPKEGEDPGVDFELFYKKKLIVVASLIKTGAGHWETHIGSLPYRFRGQGWGVHLYTLMLNYALRRGYKVCSSTHPSKYARTLWKSERLRKAFQVTWKGKFYEVNKK
jgi:GNAT superfamily N-acetyltransferase